MGTGDIGGPFVFPAAPGNSFIVGGDSKAIAGMHLGIQHQMGNFVLGVEGGFRTSLSDGFASSAGLGNAPPIGCNAATVFNCQGRIANIQQIGPRLGWAQNNWMVYGTGGFARAEIMTQATTIATGVPLAQASQHHDGRFAGGGVEYALTPGIILGVEYTHYQFDTVTHDIGGNSRFVSADADTVMARLSLKLGREDRLGPLK
jgi:outer membrane immunogenic protein